MQNFAYARAGSVPEALAEFQRANTAVLAGGTELLNWMRLGVAAPERVIDISRIAELEEIVPLANGGLRIGALARLNDVAGHARVAADFPVLEQAIHKAASPQLRNLATIGGNLLQKTRCAYFRSEEPVPCNKRIPGSGCSALHGLNDKHAVFGWSEKCVATQPSDPAVALVALDATLVTESLSGGRRIPCREFHTLPGERPEIDNVLATGELIVAIEVPAAPRRSFYLKVRERESYEYATVSAAVVVDLDGEVIREARIALGSVAHRPWRLAETERRLPGTRVGSAEARAAIDAGFADARPLEHNAYKVALARNAVLRVLEIAARG